MQHKAWALLNYSLNILLLLAVLLVRLPTDTIITSALLMLNLCSLLALLSLEPDWDATHWLGLYLLILTALFVILFLATTHTGVSCLYGATLILASFCLIITESIANWRSSAFNQFLNKFHPDETTLEQPEQDDIIVEEITPHHERKLLTRKGTTTYHKEGCITLRNVPKEDLIEISDGEALAYDLAPCKACKPYRE